MPRILGACCVLLMFSCSLFAQGNSSNNDKDKGKPPRIAVDMEDTPLHKAMRDLDTKINEKLKLKKNDPDCSAALDEADDPNDKHKKARNIAAKCKVMQMRQEALTDEESKVKDAKGKVVGRRNKFTVYLDHPSRRYLDENNPPPNANKWDDFGYTGRPFVSLAGADRVKNPSSVRVHNAVLPDSQRINEDNDCIDRATNDHIAGILKDEQGNPKLDAQGNLIHPCFADFTNRVLINRLVPQSDGTYLHSSGRVYSAEEYAALPNGNTIEELFDEDSAVGESAGIDDDGDGVIDEDGPNQSATDDPCLAKGGKHDPNAPAGTESCDFTEHIRKGLQDRFAEHNKKLFKLDDNGNCDADPHANGEYPCGEEPREVEIEETVMMRCPPNSELVDDGRCMVAAKPGLMATGFGMSEPYTTSTKTDTAMMGFTFAPPVLEWGINERWRVCVFGFCFEVFSIRFGYEFDVAAGLRLPVELTVKDVPDEVLAETTATMPVSLEPKDFRVNDYVDFCSRHHLDSAWWISDCNRFAFPEYFASMLPDSLFEPAGNRQGSEFVAQASIFAGLKIAVFTVPVVDFAIDSSVNVPAMCSLKKMKEQLTSSAEWVKLLSTFATDLSSPEGQANAKTFLKSLEDSLANCATFTTPWGSDSNGPRQFPFLTTGFSIPADCIKAAVDDPPLEVGGQKKPMCTGLKVNIYGATLGLGLEIVPEANSKLIKAEASASGDASTTAQTLSFEFGEADPKIANVAFDNFSNDGDLGEISLNDFTYYLNNFGIQLNGKIELGGILSFIGDVATVPLVHVSFDTGTFGIPVPQHPGTGPVKFEVPVTNYALSVDGRPYDDDPMRSDTDTLRIKPGTPGTFEVRVRNEGTKTDTIDNFKFELSNRPVLNGTNVFTFNRNNDFDCVDKADRSKHFFGYPYDGVQDECYDAAGNVRTDRVELIDEDGPNGSGGTVASRDDDKDGLADEDPAGDDWLATFSAGSVANVASRTTVNRANALAVTPFAHPLTKPGDYPVRITADSQTARNKGLQNKDPFGLSRIGAEDIVMVRIESFFDPQVVVTPSESSVKPGGSATYVVEAVNGGNQNDQIGMAAIFADSDTANCTLTTNGQGTMCPYRALVTRIDPTGWTNVSELDSFFPASGQYAPLENGRDSFAVRAPADWAGMDNTVYEFTLTATSTADQGVPKAKKEFKAHFTIQATKESMTRYVNLEVAEFLDQVNQAVAAGAKTRGIQPVTVHPVSMMTTKALEQILAGDLGGASKTLSSATKVMEAVARMVAGADLPEPLASDWKARTAAILSDMAKAQASTAQ